MHDTSDKYFLQIEPQTPKSALPVRDALTAKVTAAMCRARHSGKFYAHPHACICGAQSDKNDWALPDGRITNSLALHYVEYHRDALPRDEIAKIEALPY